MTTPTPDEYIVYRAKQWRQSDQAVISATGPQKEAARQAHRKDIRNLREAVDLAVRKAAHAAPISDKKEGGEP